MEEAKRTEEAEGDLSRAPLPSDDLLSVSSGSLKPIGWGLGRDDRRDGRRSGLHRCRQFLAHRRPGGEKWLAIALATSIIGRVDLLCGNRHNRIGIQHQWTGFCCKVRCSSQLLSSSFSFMFGIRS